jgi:hypothetical protein
MTTIGSSTVESESMTLEIDLLILFLRYLTSKKQK